MIGGDFCGMDGNYEVVDVATPKLQLLAPALYLDQNLMRDCAVPQKRYRRKNCLVQKKKKVMMNLQVHAAPLQHLAN